MEQYPEQPPELLKPLDTFRFSTSKVDTFKKDFDLRVEAYRERIRKLNDKSTIDAGGVPFNALERILDISHNKEELNNLGKALIRVSEFIEEYDELTSRAAVLGLIEKDSSWLASAFGDFEDELEDDLNNIEAFFQSEQ